MRLWTVSRSIIKKIGEALSLLVGCFSPFRRVTLPVFEKLYCLKSKFCFVAYNVHIYPHLLARISLGFPSKVSLQVGVIRTVKCDLIRPFGMISSPIYCNDVILKYWCNGAMIMMTSSNGNLFRVTGPLCGELTGHRWIPHTKASDASRRYFLWSASK